jgi:NADH-quinone oxidoreductase subunit C
MAEHAPTPAKAPPAMQTAEWEGALPERLFAAFPDAEIKCESYLGQNFVAVSAQFVATVITYLHDHEQFDFLVDLTAVDHPKDQSRFELIYILYSFPHNQRIRIKTRVAESENALSIASLFLAANWLEREVFDMFGVQFTGHPNLKRILMPEDWQGFPLRKDASIIGMDNDWVRTHLGIESGQ